MSYYVYFLSVHIKVVYICNLKLSADCRTIKIGPKRESIRKSRWNLLFFRGKKLPQESHRWKAHLHNGVRFARWRSHFEDWRPVFLRWLDIFVFQSTSDRQRRRKKWKKYFQSLLENFNFYSDSFDVINFIQFTLNTRRPWKGRQENWGSNSWSWFHFPVLQVCSTTQSWIPRNTITLNIRPETNINLGKKAKLGGPPIE